MQVKETWNISEQQKPIDIGFGYTSTSYEVMSGMDLSNKNVIVTGGYSGLGFETVKRLLEAGAQLILPVRNVDTVKELFKEFSDRVEVVYMDLLKPASIDAFAEQFISSGRPLHLLINNAGIMACPLQRDERGYEYQFATNHLGHYQLTLRLWDALKNANGARVVNVSSMGHRYSDIRYDDLHFDTTPYDAWKAYGQSKTANVLFTVQLDGIGREYGIRSFAVHPGRILETNLAKYIPKEELDAILARMKANNNNSSAELVKTMEQGAATSLFCATSPALNAIGGVYCEDCNISQVLPIDTDITKMLNGVLPYAVDRDNAARLWDLSYRLTGLTL